MRRLVYEGSVKSLWDLGPDKIEFEYSDAFSVFDWGRMPDQLAFKGESLAALGAFFFRETSRPKTWARLSSLAPPALRGLKGRLREVVDLELSMLQEQGLKSHFIERSGPKTMTVKRVSVTRPAAYELGGQILHHYNGEKTGSSGPSLIPLEVVFRFGMPAGSSLAERLTPEYSRALGFKDIPKAGAFFETPIIEFFTKLESTDRFLTWEQALNYSGLGFQSFEQLVARTACLAIWLSDLFRGKGLELWDGKFEWAISGSGKSAELLIVDSIGPDELRLVDPATGTQISKEFLRQFYRETKWFEAVKSAKATHSETELARTWKDAVLQSVGPPPRLDAEFRSAADALYPSLALAVCGENPGGLGLPLKTMLERIARCLAN